MLVRKFTLVLNKGGGVLNFPKCVFLSPLPLFITSGLCSLQVSSIIITSTIDKRTFLYFWDREIKKCHLFFAEPIIMLMNGISGEWNGRWALFCRIWTSVDVDMEEKHLKQPGFNAKIIFHEWSTEDKVQSCIKILRAIKYSKYSISWYWTIVG